MRKICVLGCGDIQLPNMVANLFSQQATPLLRHTLSYSYDSESSWLCTQNWEHIFLQQHLRYL
jgi:hypothetical protein